MGERFGDEALEGWLLFDFNFFCVCEIPGFFCHISYSLTYPSRVEFLGKKQDDLVAMLEAEEDFQSSKTMLEELLTKLGARGIMIPKYHCEFNPIECNYRY